MRLGKYQCKLGIILLSLLLAGLMQDSVAAPMDWSELNQNEKSVLSAYSQQWNAFSEDKQHILRRWANKPPEERRRIRQRYQDWNQLSTAQKQKVMQQLIRFKQMSDIQRAHLRAWYDWMKTLPAAEREKIKQLWPGMNDSERRLYIKELRAKYGDK